MRFNYTALLSSAPDTGEPVVIFRPEIRLTVHGPSGSGDFLALVDSGADNTILPESIARALGIPLTAGTGPARGPSAGKRLPCLTLTWCWKSSMETKGSDGFPAYISSLGATRRRRSFWAIRAFSTILPRRLSAKSVSSTWSRTHTCQELPARADGLRGRKRGTRFPCVPLSEAKANLSRYGRLCHDEPVIVTVNGTPAFQLAPPDADDDLIDSLLEHNPSFRQTLQKRLAEGSLSVKEARKRL